MWQVLDGGVLSLVLVVLVLLVVEAMLGGSVELSVREVAPGNLVDIF